MLRALLNIANSGWTFQVNELAGGSHSAGSKHYYGRAVDVQVGSGTVTRGYADLFMQKCRNEGATVVLGPGNPGHNNHVHCQWS